MLNDAKKKKVKTLFLLLLSYLFFVTGLVCRSLWKPEKIGIQVRKVGPSPFTEYPRLEILPSWFFRTGFRRRIGRAIIATSYMRIAQSCLELLCWTKGSGDWGRKPSVGLKIAKSTTSEWYYAEPSVLYRKDLTDCLCSRRQWLTRSMWCETISVASGFRNLVFGHSSSGSVRSVR